MEKGDFPPLTRLKDEAETAAQSLVVKQSHDQSG